MTNFIQINKYHTIILFFLSIIFFTLNINIQADNITAICFFLIVTVGVSHGSLDHIKGNKLLELFNIKNKLLFYFGYIVISLTIIVLWLILPLITLAIFLIVAAYHFGKEDAVFGKNKKTRLLNLFLFLKGSLVILAPLYFNPEETIKIFETLNVQLNQINNNILIAIIVLSLISNFFVNKNIFLSFLDSFTIIMLNLNFVPLVAFTIYFCFLHSIRHSLLWSLKLLGKTKNSLKEFLIKSFPLTLITALLFIISVYLLYLFESSLYVHIILVTFVGLASLTFPHILLEYLIEKNE